MTSRRSAAGIAFALGLALAVGWWLSRAPDVSPDGAPPDPTSATAPAPTPPSWAGSTPAATGNHALRGAVLRDGKPVSGAEVWALREAEEHLDERDCECDFCVEHLLSCDCPQATRQLVELATTRTSEATPLAHAVSAADGTFSLTGLDGRVTLWAQAGDGLGWLRDVPLDATDVRLELTRGDFVEGKVLKPDASPFGGAAVAVVTSSPRRFFDAQSDATGAFRLGPVPRGEGVVVAWAEGHLPAHRVLGASLANELATLARELGELPSERPGVRLRLEQPRRLGGRVTRGGQPVSGAEVRVVGEHQSHTCVTDARGAFELAGLRPGRYALVAKAPAGLAELEVTLARLEDLLDAELRLEDAVEISGVVTDERGAALGGVTLMLWTNLDELDTESDEDGRFRFERVTEGVHRLSAQKSGYVAAAQEVTGPGVRVVLARAARLTGHVVTPDGGHPRVFAVSAMGLLADGGPDLDGDRGAFTSGDADGGFALDVGPGLYEVRVKASPFAPATIHARAPDDVLISLELASRVTGTVLDLDGLPTPGVAVSVARSPDEHFDVEHSRTDVAGHFSISVSSGRQVVVADGVTKGERWRAEAEVSLAVGEERQVVLRPTEGAALAGVVVDGSGRPLAGVDVSAWSQLAGHHQSARTQTDQRGRWKIRTLPAGPVVATANSAQARAEAVHTTAPDDAVKLVLDTSTVVVGRVLDQRGKPITHFFVDQFDQEAADGRFELAADPSESPRQYEVSADGYAPRFVSQVVKTGRNDLGDVVLSRGRPLTGVVLDATTHAPIAGARLLATNEEHAEANDSVRTGADGRFALAAVDPTTRFLVVSHPAYPRVVRPLSPSDRAVEVTLTRGSLLRVALRDAGGQTVRNAVVLLSREEEDQPTHVTSTATEDSSGEYLAAGLQPGQWTISVHVLAHQFRAQRVEVTGGEQRVELDEVTGGVTVKVKVPDAHYFRLSSTEVGTAQMEGDVAQHVTPGTWKLAAFRSTHGAREISIHTLTVTEQPAQEFTLTPVWRPLRESK